MLEKVRKPGRAKGLFAYVVFGAICLVFVFFGLVPGQLAQLSGGGAAAMVGDEQISIADFSQRVQALERQYDSILGSVPAAKRNFFTSRIRSQAMEQLIDMTVLSQSAASLGIVPSSTEVADQIKQIPVFNEDGKFRRSRYDMYLTNSRMQASEFESKLKSDLAISRLRNLFIYSLKESQLEKIKNQISKQVKVNFKFVDLAGLKGQTAVNLNNTQLDEFVSQPDIKKKAEAYYKKNISEFTVKESVSARHILIKTGKDRTADQALAMIKKIQERIKTEDFGKVAKEVSEDPGSASKNGDLGSFEKGRMVAEFEQVAFGLPIGKISSPVKTSYGYHIIKIEDRKDASVSSFEDSMLEIARILYAEKASEDLIKKIAGYLKNNDQSKVSAILKKYKITWTETGAFDLEAKTIPKLGDADNVLEAVLAHAKPKTLLPKLVKSQGKKLVILVKSVSGMDKIDAEAKEVLDLIGKDTAKRPLSVFDLWVKGRKDSVVISRNQALLGQAKATK